MSSPFADAHSPLLTVDHWPTETPWIEPDATLAPARPLVHAPRPPAHYEVDDADGQLLAICARRLHAEDIAQEVGGVAYVVIHNERTALLGI